MVTYFDYYHYSQNHELNHSNMWNENFMQEEGGYTAFRVFMYY